MGRKISIALEGRLSAIEFWEMQLHILTTLGHILHEGSSAGRSDDELNAALNVISQRLLHRLHFAYSEFFAVSFLGNEEQMRKARKVAYRRYFSKGKNLIHLLNSDLGLPPHVYPEKWPAGLEDKLRAEIEAEMAKEG